MVRSERTTDGIPSFAGTGLANPRIVDFRPDSLRVGEIEQAVAAALRALEKEAGRESPG
jgi:hypothetical protein